MCHDLLKSLDDYPKTIMSGLNNALMNVVARATQGLLHKCFGVTFQKCLEVGR